MTRLGPCLIAGVLLSSAVVAGGELTPSQRSSLIARAQVWTPTAIARADVVSGPRVRGAIRAGETIRCAFEDQDFEGRSPKFMCRIDPRDTVKVKFGGDNGEVFGEVAATRLLWALGFPADAVYPARVLCRGCPDTIGVPTATPGERLVEPAAIKRRLSTEDVPEGLATWSWPELESVNEAAGGAPLAHRDALKLLAALMQHTDSKAEQQRLVCVDGSLADGSCRRPMLMLNDLGLTFGRASFTNANHISGVNLPEWSATPVWKGAVGCVAHLPKSFTGTLRDPVISEAGRRFLADLLAQLSDAQIRSLFEVAGVHRREPAVLTGSVDAWVAGFRAKQREVTERECLASWSMLASPLFDTEIILRLQAHHRPALSVAMNAVSTLGYMRVFVALAVVIAFVYHLRAGATLPLLLALTGTLVDAAKSAAGLPRPHAVDSRVQALTNLPLVADAPDAESAKPSVDDDDVYGFPSGHVAVTTAFLLGLTLVVGWRNAWKLALLIIPVMALSRLYLGRHFPADIIGGVAVGLLATAVVMRMRLWRLDVRGRARNTALRVGAVGAVAVALGIGIDMPPPYEAGRLAGVSAAVTLLGLRGEMGQSSGSLPAWTKILIAALLFGVTWWATSERLVAAGLSASRIGHVLAGALPAFVLLPGPVYLPRLLERLTPRNVVGS